MCRPRSRADPWADATFVRRMAVARSTSAGQEAQPDGSGLVVAVGIHEADGLPRAEREPAADDRHRQRWRDEQRQDVVGAMAGRPVAVAVEPFIAREQPVEGVEEILVRAGARLDHHHARGGVRDEHRQQAVAVVGRGPDERLALGGQVEESAVAPGPDRDLARLYGKMLRMASRSRPSPPPTGADSYRGSPDVSTDAPHPSRPTDVA